MPRRKSSRPATPERPRGNPPTSRSVRCGIPVPRSVRFLVPTPAVAVLGSIGSGTSVPTTQSTQLSEPLKPARRTVPEENLRPKINLSRFQPKSRAGAKRFRLNRFYALRPQGRRFSPIRDNHRSGCALVPWRNTELCQPLRRYTLARSDRRLR